MQMEMFDKPIAEVRAIQVVNKVTGEPLSWSLEYRFVGEEKWNPIKLEVYAVELKEEENESGTASQEATS